MEMNPAWGKKTKKIGTHESPARPLEFAVEIVRAAPIPMHKLSHVTGQFPSEL